MYTDFKFKTSDLSINTNDGHTTVWEQKGLYIQGPLASHYHVSCFCCGRKLLLVSACNRSKTLLHDRRVFSKKRPHYKHWDDLCIDFWDWRAGDWRVYQRSRLMQFPVCLSCVHPVTLNANCCFVMFLIFTTSVLYFLMYFYVKIWIIGCWPASSEIDGEALALGSDARMSPFVAHNLTKWQLFEVYILS